jgi:hypothetical protein
MTSKRHKSVLDNGDVKDLLRAEIEMAEGQAAFARKSGLQRVNLNKIVQGKRPLNEADYY